MSDLPIHAEQHNELLRMVARYVEASSTIHACILITIGVDQRPMIGGNLSNEDIHRTLRILGGSEDMIATIYNVDTKGN